MANKILHKYPTDGVIRAYVMYSGATAVVRIFDEHGKLNTGGVVARAEVKTMLEDYSVERAYEWNV